MRSTEGDQVVGVFGSYSDVTHLLDQIKEASARMRERAAANLRTVEEVAAENQRKVGANVDWVLGIIGGLLLLLYAALWILARNAQRLMTLLLSAEMPDMGDKPIDAIQVTTASRDGHALIRADFGTGTMDGSWPTSAAAEARLDSVSRRVVATGGRFAGIGASVEILLSGGVDQHRDRWLPIDATLVKRDVPPTASPECQ